jgi:predicted transcriptional regulator
VTSWTFLSNHGRALLCIANDPSIRLRDIASELGVTERSAYSIVSDLDAAGYIVKQRDGRRNRYLVQEDLPLPEATDRELAIGQVLGVLKGR